MCLGKYESCERLSVRCNVCKIEFDLDDSQQCTSCKAKLDTAYLDNMLLLASRKVIKQYYRNTVVLRNSAEVLGDGLGFNDTATRRTFLYEMTPTGNHFLFDDLGSMKFEVKQKLSARELLTQLKYFEHLEQVGRNKKMDRCSHVSANKYNFLSTGLFRTAFRC